MSSDRSGTRTIRLRASGILLMVLVACLFAGREFAGMWTPDEFHPSKGLFRRGSLSDYFPPLRNTRADASLFMYTGERPGPTVLVLGGTHPNEPAGFMAATVLVENALVRAGRLIVVPQACQSGFTCTDPLEGTPSRFTIVTPSGERTFRFGSRGANVVDQWPDPLVYLHHPSGQKLSGNETRNLNRAYPGRADGLLTEQAAFAIMRMIERESVRVAIDLHEAAPEIPIINAIVTHEKGREIAAEAVLDLELQDLQYALEFSPPNFRGLSHREWGDRTEAIPFLMETSNPIKGRLRGKTTVDLLISGRDGWYAQAAALGTMRIAYARDGESLSKRVGRHLEGIRALVEAYNAQRPAEPFTIEGVPGYSEMMRRGIGAWLR
jgi:hypothetical protein